MEIRLKPSSASRSICDRVVMAGSISTAFSPSGANWKWRVMISWQRVSCFSSRKVGVPPPQWSWVKVRRLGRWLATSATSFSRTSR
jgi:hypothetical protein